MASTHISERNSRSIFSIGDESRQTRIAKLLMELATIRPARRRDDEARRRTIEAELVLLLDAEIMYRRMAREAANSMAASATTD
jgi:hypothetical protein